MPSSTAALIAKDTIQKPPDRVFLIAHFSAWRSPRATRIALSGLHRLAGSNNTKPLAPPCAPNPRRDINNSRPGRAPERLNLVRSRKRSQTLIKEWKYVLVCHMTPPSRRICPLGPYISNLIFGLCDIYIPGGPVGPPVARSAANPWAPGFENLRGLARPELIPQPRGFCPNLFPAKALASAAQPDRRRARVGGG